MGGGLGLCRAFRTGRESLVLLMVSINNQLHALHARRRLSPLAATHIHQLFMRACGPWAGRSTCSILVPWKSVFWNTSVIYEGARTPVFGLMVPYFSILSQFFKMYTQYFLLNMTKIVLLMPVLTAKMH